MNTNYTVTGKGEPVLLVHGSMGSKEQWHVLQKSLASRFRVLSIDLLGYGKSPWPQNPETYSLGDECAQLLELSNDVFGPGKSYHLVGHSYGGAVAIRHTYYHGQRVKSLTTIEPMCYHILSANHPLRLSSEAMVLDLVSDIEKGRQLFAAEKFIDLWMAPGTFTKLRDSEKQRLGEGVKKMVYDYRAAKSEPLTAADLARINQPFCLILGRESLSYSLSISEVVAEAIRQREVHWIHGGHFIPFTDPVQVNAIILDFLSRHGITPAHQT